MKNTGITSIADILKSGDPSKYTGTSSVKGIHTQWQEKAFRYADELGIKLEGSSKGRWLKAFKQASTGRKTANLESAYRFLIDYPKPMSNEQKILFFFKIYENGLGWLKQNTK